MTNTNHSTDARPYIKKKKKKQNNEYNEQSINCKYPKYQSNESMLIEGIKVSLDE